MTNTLPNFFDRYKSCPLPPQVVSRNGQTLMTMQRAGDVEPLGNKTYRFIITSETPDRYNDIVKADGGIYTNYTVNPVVLFNHISSERETPIGRNLLIRPGKGVVVAETEFHDITQLAREVEQLVAQKYLRAVSIGFIPMAAKEVSPSDIGLDQASMRPSWSPNVRVYTEWEMLEYSVVNIPANPDALILNSYGQDLGRALHDGAIGADSALLAAIHKQAPQIQNIITSKITVTDMATTKQLDAQKAQEMTASIKSDVVALLLKVLQNYGLDFSTADVKQCADDFAQSVAVKFGALDKAPDATATPTDPNAPADPSATDTSTTPAIATVLDAYTALLPLHEQELAVAQAALALSDIDEDSTEFFTQIEMDTELELDEINEAIASLQADGSSDPATTADPNAAPAPGKNYKAWLFAWKQKKGAKISAANKAIVNQINDTMATKIKMAKDVQGMCQKLLASGGDNEPNQASFDDSAAWDAIERVISQQLSK